ncbi:MAG: Crp/Fnr family transcriptional regulator [endosymbiont of Galathealinum brachiosum]|uniref:Crp/Fnr family transcriptional regulator n=1 Tax=endosymbiont of Galathealinum brachiosum TaxID=2200906 RepID=A0A370DDT2_9GAMM|nr:MAG: Crp/Fnr family transcriptional regulator [endosymbiont of Galathealinum brachiosum]
MQLYNTQTSLSDATELSRFQKINSTYTELADIRNKTWIDTIDNARLLEAAPDTTLFSGNATCNNFMLILEGTIRIYQTAEDGREITLYRVEAGDLCILSLNSLLKNKSFNAIAVTESNVRALVISSNSFKTMMNEIEPFRDYVISTLTERLCETIYLIQDTAFNHLNMRLACMLGSLFERNQGPTLKITHQELAFELGTTREVISRILKEFERQDCVKLSRGYIELSSAEGLQWFSEPA